MCKNFRVYCFLDVGYQWSFLEEIPQPIHVVTDTTALLNKLDEIFHRFQQNFNEILYIPDVVNKDLTEFATSDENSWTCQKANEVLAKIRNLQINSKCLFQSQNDANLAYSLFPNPATISENDKIFATCKWLKRQGKFVKLLSLKYELIQRAIADDVVSFNELNNFEPPFGAFEVQEFQENNDANPSQIGG